MRAVNGRCWILIFSCVISSFECRYMHAGSCASRRRWLETNSRPLGNCHAAPKLDFEVETCCPARPVEKPISFLMAQNCDARAGTLITSKWTRKTHMQWLTAFWQDRPSASYHLFTGSQKCCQFSSHVHTEKKNEPNWQHRVQPLSRLVWFNFFRPCPKAGAGAFLRCWPGSVWKFLHRAFGCVISVVIPEFGFCVQTLARAEAGKKCCGWREWIFRVIALQVWFDAGFVYINSCYKVKCCQLLFLKMFTILFNFLFQKLDTVDIHVLRTVESSCSILMSNAGQ